MLDMAKRRNDKPKRVRRGYNLNVWVSDALGVVIEAFMATSRPPTDKTGITETALEDYFAAKGLWPPPQQPREG